MAQFQQSGQKVNHNNPGKNVADKPDIDGPVKQCWQRVTKKKK